MTSRASALAAATTSRRLPVAAAAPGRPRVLHVVSTLLRGGTEIAMLRLLEAMDHEAWSFRVAWLRDDADPRLLAEAERITGARVPCLGLRSKVDPRALVRLVAFLRAERIDLLHTHMDLADYYGAAAARLLGLRLISTRENADEFRTRRTWKRPPFLFLEHAAYAAADATVAVSEHLVDFLERAEGLPRHKTVVIRNGIDAAALGSAPGRDQARRRLGLPDGAPVLGTVGRLAAQKGQIDLVEALPAIALRHPDVRLLIAGEGPERKALEARLGDLDLGRRVTLLGHVADVPAFLQALDLFVLPSLWEGLPLALLEAMAMGLPVAASRASGIVEAIDHGAEGLLFEPGDRQGLAAAVLSLLDDPGRAARIAAAARRRVLERHTLEAVAARTEALYRRVLGGGS
jgi:glycosyltransferase involved in cell wall biosynthesis